MWFATLLTPSTTGFNDIYLHIIPSELDPKGPGPEAIKLISCSTQISMKICLPINIKMPTKVGIFIFISREIVKLRYI